jgi:hypothetical protein
MSTQKSKSVKPEEESLLRRILSPLATILGRGKSATVEKVRFTPFQVSRIYKLFDSGKYSISQISMMVGLPQTSIRSWLDKREPKVTQEEILEMRGFNERFDENGKRIPRSQRKKLPGIIPLTEKKATKNLNDLYATEKYPTEHQGDPRYFGGVTPPQAIATEEAFKDQKRRNNIGRATMKKIIISREEANLIPKEDVARAYERHSKKEPNNHHGSLERPNRCCCEINEPDWVKIFPVNNYETWTTNNHRQNWEKKKLGERLRAEEEARKKNLKTDYFCWICNTKITDEQSKKSSQEFGKFYCVNCIPSPDQPKGGFIL